MEPKIRLKGFSGNWEDTTIGNIATVVGGGTPSTINPLYWNGPIQWFTPSEVGHTKYVEKSERTITKDGIDGSSARIIPANSLLLSSRATIGEASINICECTTNQGFQSLVPINVDLEFLYSLMITKKSDLLRESNGSTFLEISASKVKSIDICVPEKNEQQALGSYFQHLDYLIQSTTKKIESLKQVKSASLQSMFPQEGETVPRVRFKGFEGDWEEISLRKETYPAGVKNHDNLPLESYSISNEFGFIPQNVQFENGGTMATADKRMYYIVSKNSFGYNPARINVGSLGYYSGDDDVIVSSLYEIFKTSDRICDTFMLYWFKTSTFQKLIEKYQEGGVRFYFFYDKLCMCNTLVPSYEEQKKIADYFTNLDSQIALQTQRLEKLKQIKSACLDNMFV